MRYYPVWYMEVLLIMDKKKFIAEHAWGILGISTLLVMAAAYFIVQGLLFIVPFSVSNIPEAAMNTSAVIGIFTFIFLTFWIIRNT